MSSPDYVLISPVHFADAMRTHWTETLGNVWSPALHDVWINMGSAFGKAIIDFDQGIETWHVLQPPTGTGKTQGTCVYCSMVAQQNTKDNKKLGILIVTRLITEADGLVKQINELAGRACAAAKHSQAKTSRHEADQADILIVTHAAYVKALEQKTINEDDDDRWSSLINWKHGKRRLTIIDETLSEIIAYHQVKAEDIRFALGFVSQQIRTNHEWAVKALEEMLTVLEQIAAAVDGGSGLTDKQSDNHSRIVWRAIQEGRIEYPEDMGLGELRSTLSTLPYDLLALQRESAFDRERIKQRVDDTLAACEGIFSMWGFYAKKGREHTLNTSKLLIPDKLPSPVVLDATATQNFLWELLGSKVHIHKLKTHPRSYRNVTLHLGYAVGLGKTKMRQLASERFPKLLTELQAQVHTGSQILLCTHKAVEHIPLQYEHSFRSLNVAHWGFIDGRNDWQDFDTVVLFGLPYRDNIWANNAFIALQGLPEDDWMQSPRWMQYEDIRQEMQIKQLSVSLIQAINRIRCRRVIDDKGNCEKADVYLLLPQGEVGRSILSNIEADMPDIQVVGWDYAVDEPWESRVRKGSSHEAILIYMTNAEPGEYQLTALKDEFDLKPDAYKALQATLRDHEHSLTKALTSVGVTYHSFGKGRGSKSFLIKRR